jgi:parallel beta helix pectate lyase-like protein
MMGSVARALAPWAAVAVVASIAGTGAAAIGPRDIASNETGRLCQRVAAPNGNDSNSGTSRSPFASVSRLVAALRPGQTGCLASGRFQGDVRVSRRGGQKKPTTLRAVPGGNATICGYIEFRPTADHWRLTGLRIDGSCSDQNTIQIFADHITLDHDDVTNSRRAQSCVYIGNPTYGRAANTVLRNDRIHDCGNNTTFTHGIYADSPRNAKITDNYIYSNAGFGVQLYPDAENTLFERNVVDSSVGKSGLIFSGEAPYASSHNLVTHNVFSSNGAYGVSSWWGGPVGKANLAESNCFWRNADGAVDPDRVGYRSKGNITANPLFVSQRGHDYRLRRGSRCRMMEPRGHVGP